MSSEKTLLTTYCQGDDRAGQGSTGRCRQFRFDLCHTTYSPPNRRTVHFLLHLHLRLLAIRSLAHLDCLARAILRFERALEHIDRDRALDFSKTDRFANEGEGGRETQVHVKERNKWACLELTRRCTRTLHGGSGSLRTHSVLRSRNTRFSKEDVEESWEGFARESASEIDSR